MCLWSSDQHIFKPTESNTGTTTLVFRIIEQVGKISKIDKSAGWNKAMQVGILGILLL